MLTIDKSELKIGAVLSIVFVVLMALMMTRPQELEAQSAGGVVTGRATCATTATLMYTAPLRGGTLLVRNAGTGAMFLGGTSGVVTASGSFEVPAGSAVSLVLLRRQTVYCIVASGTERADYIEGPVR